ncbi:Neuroligin-3 [Nymphon striatum]|nr:Neuroligin-3 [Nymphon striatum]
MSSSDKAIEEEEEIPAAKPLHRFFPQPRKNSVSENEREREREKRKKNNEKEKEKREKDTSPNNFLEGDHRTRFNRFNWPTYTVNEKKSLAIGLKPRVKDHYRAHKLSTWLNLVPKLIGIPDVDWIIKTTPKPSTTESPTTSSSLLSTLSTWLGYESDGSQSPPSKTGDNRNSSWPRQGVNFTSNLSNKDSDSTYIYSTALSVTIAVGCSLLILNIFAFVALYYKKQKTEETKNEEERSYKKAVEGSSQNSFGEKQVIVAPSELQTMFSLEKSTMNCDSIDPRNRDDIVMNCKRRETKIETAFDREIYETNYTTTFVRPNEINV